MILSTPKCIQFSRRSKINFLFFKLFRVQSFFNWLKTSKFSYHYLLIPFRNALVFLLEEIQFFIFELVYSVED